MTDNLELTSKQRDGILEYFGENSLIYGGEWKDLGIMWEEVKNFLNENTVEEECVCGGEGYCIPCGRIHGCEQ